VRKLSTLLFSGVPLALTFVLATFVSTAANAAPNSIEIISIDETSSTSVELFFNSNIPKKSLSYFVINVVVDQPAGTQKNIKKVIRTKSSGFITAGSTIPAC
jgi:hypothetical protein